MIERRTCYFIAKGRSHQALLDYKTEYDRAHATWNAYAATIGATNWWTDGVFALPKPRPGWRKARKRDAYKPTSTANAAEADRKAIAALPRHPDKAWIMALMGGERTFFFANDRMYHTDIGWSLFGDVYVLEVNPGTDNVSPSWIPADAEQIPTSRYWQIREAFEAESPTPS